MNMNKKTFQPGKEIDVYDFDKTIYQGDSSLDFYLFCVRKNPLILGYLLYQLWHLTKFVIKLESRTVFKSRFFRFLRTLDEPTKYVDEFWEDHYKNIKGWYTGLDHSKDVIISASPEFLLRPVSSKLKVRSLIATRMNPRTGIIKGKNCHGQEKVVRLLQTIDKPVIIKAYTDNLSDMPIMVLAKERYIVKGDKVMTLQTYAKSTRIKKVSLPDDID